MRNGDSSDSDDSYEDRKRKCKMKLQTPLMMTGRRANPKNPHHLEKEVTCHLEKDSSHFYNAHTNSTVVHITL